VLRLSGHNTIRVRGTVPYQMAVFFGCLFFYSKIAERYKIDDHSPSKPNEPTKMNKAEANLVVPASRGPTFLL
jgi:hypothetical protein